VRWFVTLFFAASLLSAVQAQDQERKLVDRLLRPDVTLQNQAQNKKFVADGAFVDKPGTVGTFYLQQKPKPKSFSGTRDFSSQQFTPRSYRGSTNEVGFSPRSANLQRTYLTTTANGNRSAHDANKIVTGRDFSGGKPFLDHGKSQKALNRQNPPLTIEQVRELLNKNK